MKLFLLVQYNGKINPAQHLLKENPIQRYAIKMKVIIYQLTSCFFTISNKQKQCFLSKGLKWGDKRFTDIELITITVGYYGGWDQEREKKKSVLFAQQWYLNDKDEKGFVVKRRCGGEGG